MEPPQIQKRLRGTKGGNYSFANWALFRREMMQSEAYNRMRLNCTPEGTLAGNRLENAASIESDDWALIGREWMALLQSTPDEYKPGVSEINEFKRIAKVAKMPFSFGRGGKIELFNF